MCGLNQFAYVCILYRCKSKSYIWIWWWWWFIMVTVIMMMVIITKYDNFIPEHLLLDLLLCWMPQAVFFALMFPSMTFPSCTLTGCFLSVTSELLMLHSIRSSSKQKWEYFYGITVCVCLMCFIKYAKRNKCWSSNYFRTLISLFFVCFLSPSHRGWLVWLAKSLNLDTQFLFEPEMNQSWICTYLIW